MKPLLPVAFAAVALALTGCYSVNTVGTPTQGSQRQVVSDKRVSFDGTLSGKLEVQEIIESDVSGDLRKIQVAVRNRYAYSTNFVYKVEWFQEDGMEVPVAAGGWKRLSLQAKEVLNISAIAPSPRARDFVIKFQEAKGNNTIF